MHHLLLILQHPFAASELAKVLDGRTRIQLLLINAASEQHTFELHVSHLRHLHIKLCLRVQWMRPGSYVGASSG